MVDGVRLVLGRADSGLFALDGICPHAGAILAEGLLDEDILICPLHAFAFEVTTGRCIDDETCSVRRYPVRERVRESTRESANENDSMVEVGL